MQEGIVAKIAQWSDGEIDDQVLIEVLDSSRPDLENHRNGFQQVVDELTEAQLERCEEIVDFCFQLMEGMEQSIDLAIESVEGEDRNTVFVAGDTIARNSFQLNRAFVEFRNQALYALGPTDIPNLNLLFSRRDQFLEEPSENNHVLFKEAVDSERVVVYEGLSDLAKEPELPEVIGLIGIFREHMAALNKLAEMIDEEGEEGDYESLFFELSNGYRALQERVPVVQMKLRTQGETELPDINFLINLLEDAAQGNIADELLTSTLEEIDERFAQSREELEQATGHLDSALANDELEAVQETFEELDDGMTAAHKFLEIRDRAMLMEAKGCLIEFGKRFTAHQEKLQEIEANQGKVLCPGCATPNESTRSRCTKCGAPLPQNVAAKAQTTFETKEHGALDQEDNEVLVTANLAKLYEAVNNVAAGEIDHETFLDELDRFENLVEAGVSSLPQEPDMEDETKQTQVSNLYDDFEQGVETMRQAMDILRSFPERNDETVLAEGVRLVDEGANLVQKASQAFAGKPG